MNASSRVIYYAVLDNTTTVPDEADVLIDIKVNDVRRKSDLSDYTGELGVGSSLRLTDKANGPSGREDGTVCGHHRAVHRGAVPQPPTQPW